MYYVHMSNWVALGKKFVELAVYKDLEFQNDWVQKYYRFFSLDIKRVTP